MTLTATATYSDDTSAQLASVDWSSSNATVASVDKQGTVTAHAVGTGTITAARDGHSGSASVNVTPTVALDRLVVTAEKKTLRVEATTTVTLTAHYSDGSQQQVTAVAEGTAIILGTYEGRNPSVTITVIPAVSLESLLVSAGDATLTVGQTTTLTAQATYSDGSQDQVAATYFSRNKAVATVTASGTVTAVKAGTATMTGTSSGISDSVGISVRSDDTNSDDTSSDDSEDEEVTLSSLGVSASSTTLEVGTITTVTATATYSDGTTNTVTPTWSSSNTGVATVSCQGR